jgi:hypothetical protein
MHFDVLASPKPITGPAFDRPKGRFREEIGAFDRGSGGALRQARFIETVSKLAFNPYRIYALVIGPTGFLPCMRRFGV